MRWQQLLVPAALAAGAAARRSLRHVGRSDDVLGSLKARSLAAGSGSGSSGSPRLEARTAEAQFLNANTTSFAVNGTGIPDVDFDVGESYAGSLPLSGDPDDPNQLFFWFFPSTNPAASEEIVIWLNGGPGCSSLEGLAQENGPFIWQYGTFRPVPNTWAWNKLAHIVYIEQPVGTGFSVGNVTATSEEDVAAQFLGFWKNFVDTFSLHSYKVYVTGESYAGMYCPYIADAMITANDSTYYDVAGLLIYDPVIGYNDVQEVLPSVAFADYWYGLFPLNDSFVADIHARDKSCGYSAYLDQYLVYPPAGEQPTILPGQDSDGVTSPDCENIYQDIIDAVSRVNPCWDIYQVATTCPLLWDVLGFPGSFDYLPAGAEIYFDRADVKKAIHAPADIEWASCASEDVFVDDMDNSLPSGLTALPRVIDHTKNVIIGHGALDFVLIANGTLLTIQNMTWGGQRGFQSPPVEPFYVPYHDDPVLGSLAGSGIMGTAHSERGLTYVGVSLSGHMVPQYAPTAAYRHLEKLLGRIDSLASTAPFTTDTNYTQPVVDLGNGTAPQGWASGNGSSSSSAGAPGSSSTPGTTVRSTAAAAPGAPLVLVALAAPLLAVASLLL